MTSQGAALVPSAARVGAIEQPPLMTRVPPPSPAESLFTPESTGGGPDPSLPASTPPPPVHLFVFALHTGVPAGQSELFTHSTHDPPEHTLPPGLPAQSPLLLQGSQVFPDPQTGAGFEHPELLSHWHVWVEGLQVSVPQSELEMHCTHAPVAVSQRAPPQSVLEVHLRQVSEVSSQNGVDAGQSVPTTHSAQVNVTVSQAGVAPVHALVFDESHSTHCPRSKPSVPHRPFGAVQSPALHPRQLLVASSQNGVDAPQSPSPRQPTQCPNAGLVMSASHRGIVPLHAAAPVVVQGVHEGGAGVVASHRGATPMQAPLAFDQMGCTP